jgi:hypothetical protein
MNLCIPCRNLLRELIPVLDDLDRLNRAAIREGRLNHRKLFFRPLFQVQPSQQHLVVPRRPSCQLCILICIEISERWRGHPELLSRLTDGLQVKAQREWAMMWRLALHPDDPTPMYDPSLKIHLLDVDFSYGFVTQLIIDYNLMLASQAQLPSGSTNSEASYAKISSWMTACNGHAKCRELMRRSPGDATWLPTRLVDVGIAGQTNLEHKLQVVESVNLPIGTQYAGLSYI